LVENESAVIDKELYLAMQLHNQNHEASVAVPGPAAFATTPQE
jgi:hypothetical protein